MPYLFPFAHNWSASFRVDNSYKTEIIQSRVFREQRLALRSQPRKRVTLSISPTGTELRSFLSQMATRQQTEWVIPEVTRPSLTATLLSAGGNVLDFGATAPPWAVVGSYCVIQAVAGQVLAQIAVVLGGAVQIVTPVAAALPASSKVYPGIVGRLETSLKANLLTNAVATSTIVLDADPGINRVQNDSTAETTFNGRELFILKPNWQQTPQVTLESMLETIDYDRGRVVHHQPVNWNIETLRLEYLRRDQAEAEALTAFFHRRRGQQGEFYMPTWVSDFDLTTGAASGATILNVPGTTMFDLYATSPVYKAAIIFFRDGSYQANRLVSLTNVSGNSRFTFATAFPQAVNKTTVKLMCWLPAWRLAIDTLTIEWLTRTVAQAQLTMRTIEDLA